MRDWHATSLRMEGVKDEEQVGPFAQHAQGAENGSAQTKEPLPDAAGLDVKLRLARSTRNRS